VAEAAVTAARAGVAAAQANVQAQEARLQTAQAGPRPEEIHVAWQRVEEAEQALQVAQQHAADAVVTAPLAGMVTAIHAEVGQTIGAQGVLKLVSGPANIRIEVDESHVADVSVGQVVTLSAGPFGDHPFAGTVSSIAAAVDATRGTVTVTIVPDAPPDWLRFGQTVQVNIMTHPAAPRLLVPATAVMQVGHRSGVLVVERGQVRQKIVVTRPPAEQGVPVLAGLSVYDCVITMPQGLTVGDAVRIRPTLCGGH
jgi:RND family efflux transporter MFP subunit